MMHTSETKAYRIGWWTHAWWPPKSWLVCLRDGRDPSGRPSRRAFFAGIIAKRASKVFHGLPHRPWQAEFGGCLCAHRAFTAESAERKACEDLAWLLAYGEPSPRQLRMKAKRRPLKQLRNRRDDRRFERMHQRADEAHAKRMAVA